MPPNREYDDELLLDEESLLKELDEHHRSNEPVVVSMEHIPSPIGTLLAGVTDEGVCLLEFLDRPDLKKQLKRLHRFMHATFVMEDHHFLQQLKTRLQAYFEGHKPGFDLPLVKSGTVFQLEVWEQLLKIPYGRTITYGRLAADLGKPGAVRAVASANRSNGISILIPCHRVIGSDGSLTGYSGGVDRKRWLLEHEGHGQGNLDFRDS